MRGFPALIIALAFSAIFAEGAYAQLPLASPGQAPAHVTPLTNGGYVIRWQGQMPMYVTPRAGGGYVVQTPGQAPSYIRPQAGGGLTVQAPGQAPLRITPGAGGPFRRGRGVWRRLCRPRRLRPCCSDSR